MAWTWTSAEGAPIVEGVRSIERFTFAPQAFGAAGWDDAVAVERGAPVDVRVLTWNVWFADHRFDQRCSALLAELGRRRPDVVALQEVTPRLLEAVLAEPWVRAAYRVSERAVGRYQVILLSRLPIRRMAEVGLPTEMGRRLLIAELACGLTVATVHLESTSEEMRARATQLAIIQPALAAHYEDALLVGDMNFTPDAPLENAALDPTFVDVWPSLRLDEPGYTVDSEVNTMRLRAMRTTSRKRIDRMFLRSQRWQARSIELVGTHAIDGADTFISDHFGLEATFVAAPRRA